MEHPITPPPELFRQWEGMPRSLAFEAAYRAGASTELEACCQALYRRFDIPSCFPPKVAEDMRDWLRAARRPKPPSPKEQALEALRRAKPLGSFDGCMMYGSIRDFKLVLQAVQSLPDNETN